MSEKLYQQILGNAYDTIPESVRRLHAINGTVTSVGEGEVIRGTSLVARMMARALSLPPNGRHQVTVRSISDGRSEVLERRYGDYLMTSTLECRETDDGDRLVEALGPITLTVHPIGHSEGIDFQIESARLGHNGPLLPRFLQPKVQATERADAAGRYLFDVKVSTPLAGLVVHYHGWLVSSQK